MANPHDTFERTESGFFVPRADGPPPPDQVLADRMAQDLVNDIAATVQWCKSWPKSGTEKPLARGDVLDLVLTRARAFLWTREYTEQIYHAATLALFPQPANRQQRRAAARSEGKRPTLKGLPGGQAIATMDPAYAANEREAAQGYAEYDPTKQPLPNGPSPEPFVGSRPVPRKVETPPTGTITEGS